MGDDFRLHHVGYVVGEIAGAAAVYAGRYGYVAATPVIHDPLQTALVQFFRLPGDGAYLEFVAADGERGKLTGEARRRGALNHLCYTVRDMESAIERLRETRMVLISEPKVGAAFGGRRICWLMGEDQVPVELVERRGEEDLCEPGPG